MNTGITALTQPQDTSAAINAGIAQCLTFILAGVEYGVDIMKVQEIRSWEPVTSIPDTPDFMIGVCNLRGSVVPIVDLRRRFKLDSVAPGASTVVIILKIAHADNERTMGLVVDAVSEVYNISQGMLREVPELGSAINTRFIEGLVSVEGKTVILLDIDLMISPEFLNIQGSVA